MNTAHSSNVILCNEITRECDLVFRVLCKDGNLFHDTKKIQNLSYSPSVDVTFGKLKVIQSVTSAYQKQQG